MRRGALLLTAGLALSGATATVRAVETALLVAPAAGAQAELGFSGDTDGGWVALGAPGKSDRSGAVYTFDCTIAPCLAPVQVTAPVPVPGSRFGYAVALSGDTLAIGAPQDGAGRVFVFVRSGSTWTLQAQLAAFDGSVGDRFGSAVALDGDRLAVGSPRYNAARGAAYVFQRTGGSWTQVQRVTAAGGSPRDTFGAAVGLDDTTLAVGAPLHDPSGTAAGYGRGAVYVYSVGSGSVTFVTRIVADDSSNASLFGYTVAVDGTRIAAGAPAVASGDGAVYVFDNFGVWTQSQALPWTGTADAAQFGRAIALDGSRLLAGAPYAGGESQACGLTQLYVFNGAGWQTDPYALPVTPSPEARDGWSVAIDGTNWLLGAPGFAGIGANGGGAWLFDAGDALFSSGFENAGTSGCVIGNPGPLPGEAPTH